MDQNIIKCYFSPPFGLFNLFTIALFTLLIHVASLQSKLFIVSQINRVFIEAFAAADLFIFCVAY